MGAGQCRYRCLLTRTSRRASRRTRNEICRLRKDADAFQYWLRFEFGASGNPHAHGLNYVQGNPSFDECVVENEEQREALIAAQYPGAENFRTKEEATGKLADS